MCVCARARARPAYIGRRKRKRPEVRYREFVLERSSELWSPLSLLCLSLSLSCLFSYPPVPFLCLCLSLPFPFLSLPLSVPVLVYGNTSGVSEFGSAFKELEEHYPLARPAQPVLVAHGRVETRARPTDKFLTTLHLGATGAGCMCDESVVLHVQQFVGFLALLAHHECIVRLMREREREELIESGRERERERRN